MRGGEDLTRGQDWDLSLLPLELTLFLLCQQPWRRSWAGGVGWGGGLSLSPGRVGMTQFLPSPYTQVTPRNKHHTWSPKAGWPAALSAHTKDNSPFQPRCGSVA